MIGQSRGTRWPGSKAGCEGVRGGDHVPDLLIRARWTGKSHMTGGFHGAVAGLSADPVCFEMETCVTPGGSGRGTTCRASLLSAVRGVHVRRRRRHLAV